MKNKLILISLCLLLIPMSFSIEITNQSRSYVKYWKGVSNFTSEHILFENFDNRNYFIKMLVVPQLRVVTSPDNPSIWDTRLFIYNGNETVIANTGSCWEWWNNATNEQEERQYEDCPVVSFEVEPNEDITNITFVADGSHGKPSPQFRVYYYGYSTAYADETRVYSETRRVALDSVIEFFTLNLNMWKALYYLMIIILLVLAILFIVGSIPLLIKKVMVKAVK